MSDSDVKAIALFFFFTMLDEKRALHAAAQALELCERRLQANPGLNSNILIVSSTQKIWERHGKKVVRGRPQFSLESGWRLPETLNLAPWKEFQKKTPDDELLALVWSKILNFSDQEISQGLGLTEGTLRFRVGRGLRKMGTYCRTDDSKSIKSHRASVKS